MPRAPLVVLALLVAPAGLRAESPDAFFETRIRPLLVEKCQKCHAGQKTKGGLRLDSRAAILNGGDTGPAAVPGDPAHSLLVQAVRQTGELKMPPAGKLSDREIADLEQWVRLKLPWPDSKPTAGPGADLWSLKPVADPPVPAVREAAGVRNPIDAFVRAKLEARGLKPAPPADRRVLVRRVTFDLTGLPPTPEEVETFVSDPAPDAYEHLIDRLLASPAYGQRWGRHWLDLVRYCDSFDARGLGSEGDCADAWRYRDWVVDAFNRDLPYDRFVRMQVAGDVLDLPPNERTAGVVATGMLALGNWGGGDADKEKLLTDIVDDQIDVVGRSVLGLTLACARCHDHKFDPISTRDYYGLAGIFFSTHILPNVGPKTNGPPMLRIPLESPADAARRAGLEARAKTLDRELADAATKYRAALVRRLRTDLAAHLLAAHDLGGDAGRLPTLAAERGLDPRWVRTAFDAFRPSTGVTLGRHAAGLFGNPGLHGWRGVSDPPSLVANTTAGPVQFITIRMPPKSVAVHPGPASDVAVTWTSPVAGDITVAGRLTDFDPNCGDGIAYELRAVTPGGVRALAGGPIDNGQSAAFGAPAAITLRVAAGDRVELLVKRRGEYSCDTTGVELTVRGPGRVWDFAADWLAAPPPESARVGPWSVEEMSRPAAAFPAPLADAVAAWTAARQRTADRGALSKAARAVAEAAADAGGGPFLPPADRIDEFLSAADRQHLARLRGDLAAVRKELAVPKAFANGAQEGGVPGSPHAGTHDVRVHVRGRYDRLGDPVPRRFPEVVRVANPPAIAAGSGRKELADWLTRPDHPLTARVIVNRVWQYHFGEGIVRTPSNFGVLGEPPTHPDLLDHLARTFVAGGWSLKALHRYILTSATYRQSAAADPATRAADPDNRLWGRFPLRRLESEALRDSLLAVAGGLDPRPGGPATRDFNSPRRTLYLMTVRSDRTGFGPLFDVADSTAPVDRRTVSTVAPQALFLMNHPFVKAQARAFAARVQARGGSEADRLTYAHRLALGRSPTAEELGLGQDFLASAGADGWAAWCHLLLQANEFVVIE